MMDCMVDLETTGTLPEHAAILQIAAVRFDYESGIIGGTFVASMTIPYGRFWDQSTQEWWSTMPETYERVTEGARPPEIVMPEFVAWCGYDQRLWAKPSSFEYPFIDSYCRQFGLMNPFHFRSTIDVNSFIRGMAGNPSEYFDVPFEGEKHNALDDTLHQVKMVLMAKEQFRGSAPG